VSDERVEKLVEKYCAEFHVLGDGSSARISILRKGPPMEDDFELAKRELLRAALQEARREALKEAASFASEYVEGTVPADVRAEMVADLLERLAGEEGTK
jgi:biotin carboxylase